MKMVLPNCRAKNMKALSTQKSVCLCFSNCFRLSRNLTSMPETAELEYGVWAVSNLQILLQECARERNSMDGKTCHGRIVHLGLQSDTLTSNMLINMYSKCGFVEYARKVFDKMPDPSVVSWNTMIGSYTQNGNDEEGLNIFKKMRKRGTHFSEFTISRVLCACAANCAVLDCKQLHAFALKMAMDSNTFVGTALLDVYAKCNLIEEARRVFEFMHEKSAITWSSMMAGFGIFI